MLSDHSHDLAEQSHQLHIKDNGSKLFSRLLSKENSVANPSFRVYYGGNSGAIPFMWESQPGTPKHTFSEASIPPLTPPPSYYSSPTSKTMKKNPKPNLLYTLFPKPKHVALLQFSVIQLLGFLDVVCGRSNLKLPFLSLTLG
nr:hypothetical protein CFP56_59735 [Quercus suber]